MYDVIFDHDSVKKYLVLEDIKIDGSRLIDFSLLANHYSMLYRENGREMAVCDQCDQMGPSDLPECPFCGDKSDSIYTPDTLHENELEHACHVIRTKSANVSEDLYVIGRTMTQIIDDELWKQQIGNDGKPLYEGPYDCIEEQTGYKRSSAKRFVAVTREYGPKQIEEHGLSRLEISLRLPKKQLKRTFLKTAVESQQRKGGTSDRRLAESLIKSPDQKATEKKIVPFPKPKEKVKPFGVRLKPGISSAPMYKKLFERDKEGKPAMTLNEHPWCEVHLGGHVFLGIRIVRNDDGELVALLDVRESTAGSGSGSLSIGG